ncbi:histone H1.5-like [Mus pahari]|uniref:histone H1.5-like n=1 Tax=Mus pahari TaxID=10093 RepID=UPI001114933B|nr:histone H1.5-like [Mus pahari]
MATAAQVNERLSDTRAPALPDVGPGARRVPAGYKFSKARGTQGLGRHCSGPDVRNRWELRRLSVSLSWDIEPENKRKRTATTLGARVPGRGEQLAAFILTIPETAPIDTVAPAPIEKSPAKKKMAKKTKCKATGPTVPDLITKAIFASKEDGGVCLPALKKALAAGGYHVKKNNNRIKLRHKSPVNKGTLVQTKGTCASGSLKHNKNVASSEAKPKKTGAAEVKKPAGATPKKPKKAEGARNPVKKTPKKAKKPVAAGVKKVDKSPKKAKAAAKPKMVAKSPPKPKAVKSKASKPEVIKSKAAKPTTAKVKKAVSKKNVGLLMTATKPHVGRHL